MIRKQDRNQESEALSCPFCGCDPRSSRAQDARNQLYYYIMCTGYKCGAQVRAETKWESLERWNKRFTEEIVNE